MASAFAGRRHFPCPVRIMRVAIYTFSRNNESAKARCDELRAQGHDAVLHNVRYYRGEVEKCDLCVIEWEAKKRVAPHYEAAGVPIQFIGEPAVVEVPDVPPPRRRSRKVSVGSVD